MFKKAIIKPLCCVLSLLCLCGLSACGKEEEPSGGEFSSSPSVTVAEPTGTGFTVNHAVEAGFGLGSDTLDDIRVRYGEPLEVKTEEYTALTIITATYSFGEFVFNGTNGGTPLLTSVDIRSQLAAPFGINFGDKAENALEKIYTGSAAMLSGNYEQNLTFYGDGYTAPTGKFEWLTAEFVTTASTARYAAEYVAAGYGDGMNAKLTIYFNTDGQMVYYTLLYIKA